MMPELSLFSFPGLEAFCRARLAPQFSLAFAEYETML